jgi:gliding motility-associated-like protein
LGCDSLVTLDLTISPVYNDTLPPITICPSDSVLFGNQYYKSEGIYTDSLLSALGCDSIVTLDLSVYPQTFLSVNLGNDTTICWLDSLKLNAYHPDAMQYQWHDASTGITYTVYYDGQYWVKISNPCSEASDTINVTYLRAIILNLKDTVFCEDANIRLELDVASPYASYLWQDGSTSPIYLIRQAGIYSVTVSNACMSLTKEIEISTKDCDSLQIWLPNAFTPNGDGLNEVFKPIIHKAEYLKEYEMSIFDRWGNCIFSTRDYQTGWDGNDASGRPYADGVYSCLITLT